MKFKWHVLLFWISKFTNYSFTNQCYKVKNQYFIEIRKKHQIDFKIIVIENDTFT